MVQPDSRRRQGRAAVGCNGNRVNSKKLIYKLSQASAWVSVSCCTGPGCMGACRHQLTQQLGAFNHLLSLNTELL